MIKSVYKYSAEAGLPMGLYLTLMSACFLLSLRFPVLPMFLIPMALGFPFLLTYYMRRMGRREPAYMKISALWLFGIYTIIFGTLVCCLFSAVYLIFVEPGFLGMYVSNALSVIESSPAAGEYAATTELMHKAIESKLIPTATEFISTMGWLTCFAGSILSFVLALVIVNTTRRTSSDMWR